MSHSARPRAVVDLELAALRAARSQLEESFAAAVDLVFNQRNVDNRIVVNRRREPAGLVDSEDLPELKLR
jgi:hypothetical protein